MLSLGTKYSVRDLFMMPIIGCVNVVRTALKLVQVQVMCKHAGPLQICNQQMGLH